MRVISIVENDNVSPFHSHQPLSKPDGLHLASHLRSNAIATQAISGQFIHPLVVVQIAIPADL